MRCRCARAGRAGERQVKPIRAAKATNKGETHEERVTQGKTHAQKSKPTVVLETSLNTKVRQHENTKTMTHLSIFLSVRDALNLLTTIDAVTLFERMQPVELDVGFISSLGPSSQP